MDVVKPFCVGGARGQIQKGAGAHCCQGNLSHPPPMASTFRLEHCPRLSSISSFNWHRAPRKPAVRLYLGDATRNHSCESWLCLDSCVRGYTIPRDIVNTGVNKAFLCPALPSPFLPSHKSTIISCTSNLQDIGLMTIEPSPSLVIITPLEPANMQRNKQDMSSCRPLRDWQGSIV